MICKPCREAGALLVASLASEDIGWVDALHAQCPGGTWCDCQHDTSRTAFRFDRKPDPRRGA